MSESKFESVCFGLKWVSFKGEVRFKVNEKKVSEWQSVQFRINKSQGEWEWVWVQVSVAPIQSDCRSEWVRIGGGGLEWVNVQVSEGEW